MCPVCSQALVRAVIDDRDPIEICERCKGIFMPRRAFAVTVLARRRAAQKPSVMPMPADRGELERRIACPRCGSAMLTDRYYGPGNIVIDTCPTCDVVWLDAGELGRAIDAPGPDRRTWVCVMLVIRDPRRGHDHKSHDPRRTDQPAAGMIRFHVCPCRCLSRPFHPSRSSACSSPSTTKRGLCARLSGECSRAR
jgi:Zn-finger nucleic acid-binding protein